MSSSRLIYLPECIYLLLRDYVSHQEYRNLLNSGKYEYFQQLKKKYCLFHLKPAFSQIFIENETFRNEILSRIENPEKQLGLTDAFDLHILQNIHFRTLTFYAETSTEISFLSDFSMFSRVQYLDISNSSEVKSCFGLHSIIELSLSYFTILSDLSPLSHCRSLTTVSLRNCGLVRDINCLSHVNVIDINRCPITDQGISELGSSVKQLTLRNVDFVTSVNHLLSLERLDLIECRGIKSISNLPFLKNLKLENCFDLSSITNLPALKIFSCSGVPTTLVSRDFLTLQSLRKIKILFLFNDGGGDDDNIEINLLSQLPCLRSLHIGNLRSTDFNVHLFQQVTWLSLSHVPCFTGIYEPMPNLQTLRIENCENLATLIGLAGNVKMKLYLSHCKKFAPDDSLYRLLLKSVDTFVYVSFPHNMTSIEESSLEVIQPARDKFVKFSSDLPFAHSSLHSLFSHVQMLVLNGLTNVINLHQFVNAEIHKIPILSIEYALKLESLYPPTIVPRHELIILCGCASLVDISSIRNVPSVRIKNCPWLRDIRPLIGCSQIQFTKPAGQQDPQGYEELKDRIKPFSAIPELTKPLAYFSMDVQR